MYSMLLTARRLIAIVSFSLLFCIAKAQPSGDPKENKPYKVLTTGKQVTIKSNKNIQHIMLWTTQGNRVVEERNINAATYVINIQVSQKTFFLMVGLNNGKIYTEKIGIP